MALEKATFGAGCFWCTEAVFQALQGVSNVVSGYMGGEIPNPSYMDVCSGNTGHAEVIQLDYDPETISFEDLLLVFFKTHDPTTLNRQGNDTGTQYRSVIFFHNQEQKEAAMKMIDELTQELVYDKPIVTEIAPVTDFYRAEDYHQNYYIQNTAKPYCLFVIQPKLAKFAEIFREKIKNS
ncbi:peptide-methionine (S)-S-oxide reductase MsrA [Arcticibacter tournemirensis]|uniref:Peptide methionine sulfoxide reductase MsrA n=1 Tax=Arcticibacter tournemirensis TaxID=699437 RepID=A0A4Q0M557_9SPHI|nr:peptide-methionine (S)-S-oxide reductase MsrA [Arcticibacter tournemirensis]RXF68131.1 peptide-methionine (S)-S-oxide reductase [Arcticibacter tournemirensis]